MKPIRGIDPHGQAFGDPYQEVAVFVRDLLKCDYALVVVPEESSLRIQGFAGRDGTSTGRNLGMDLLSRLRDFGPVVFDDARCVAVPVSFGGQIMGALIGYSAQAGTFSGEDVEKLLAYASVASGILASTMAEARLEVKSGFTTDELLHFFRLATIGEFSACFAHEVRNPLTLIRGHLRFIDETLTSDHPLRVNVEAIERASSRIEDMAKRMLDFSKKGTRRVEQCKIAELILDALRFIQPYVKTKSIDVSSILILP
jgi:signal transduction histidine kinase